VLSHRHQLEVLDTEAEINARIASQVINANPELWRYQHAKLEEFLARRPRHGEAEARRIFDVDGQVIAQSVDPLRPPLVRKSMVLLDSGVAVGRIEISRSLWPLFLTTGWVALSAALLSCIVFVSLKTLPLRAINRLLLDNLRLLKENTRSLERMRILNEIQTAATSTLDLDALLNRVMKKTHLILPYAASTIRVINPQTQNLERVASYNIIDAGDGNAAQNDSGPGFSTEAFRTQAPVMVPDVSLDTRTRDRAFFQRNGLVSYLGLPLVAKGEILGVLCFYTKFKHIFSEDEIGFLSTLAGQVAIAIHHSQLYEQTKKQALELDVANKQQADFAAMIAHDLRSPLTVVISAAAMMEDGFFGEVTENQKNWLLRIQTESQRLVELVNDFLDLSKIEAGRIEVEREPVDLGSLIARNIEVYVPLSLEKRISLESRGAPDLPSVQADPRRLDQVLANLISNAVKFTPEGGRIEVGASLRHDRVEVYVKDTGVGIPSEELAGLFQKYRQTSSGKGSTQKGTGLGLVISKMIVEAHGGRIRVESEEGRGSTFFFYLPLSEALSSQGSSCEAPLAELPAG
jgi:signal transduction histidine kinase